MTKGKNLLYASLGEGALILLMGAIALAVRRPLIFASLGPTAYELVEKPLAPSSRTYNIIVGHMVGLSAGLFFSLVARCLERAESCIHGLCNFCAPLGRRPLGRNYDCRHFISQGEPTSISFNYSPRVPGLDADNA